MPRDYSSISAHSSPTHAARREDAFINLVEVKKGERVVRQRRGTVRAVIGSLANVRWRTRCKFFSAEINAMRIVFCPVQA
jgi:hypothetical protein